MIYVDATALRHWLDCRELYRLNQVENVKPAKTAIHREWGIALHGSIERFWLGKDFDTNLEQLMAELAAVELVGCNPVEQNKWQQMVGYAPDVLAMYYDEVEQDTSRIFTIREQIAGVTEGIDTPLVEWEWEHVEPFGIAGVALCGRVDRVERGNDGRPTLVDTKTASEVGRTWRADFKAEKLRDVGLALYDWQLCSMGHTPAGVVIEAIIKPYKDKPARVERIELPELLAYRKRFAQQLKWTLREIQHYWAAYTGTKPWPQNTNAACHGRFGSCDYIGLCNGNKKVNLLPREEHLDCRKKAMESASYVFQNKA